MSTPAAQVARSYVAPGTVWDVARNRDHTTGAGALLPQDLGATTDRPGVWLQWTMLAGFPVAHGEVADESAMLALHTFGMDSADNPSPRYVAPGDSCLRTDDPGWRWHCLCNHGQALGDWERRPLPEALAELSADIAGKADVTHTHALADLAQSGATDGQVPTWVASAGAYQPRTPSGGGSATLVSCRARHTADQAGNSALVFSATDWDTHSFWAAGQPTRLTVPTGYGGVYLVTGAVVRYAGTNYAVIRVNGSAWHGTVGPLSVTGYQSATALISLSAGDYVEFYIEGGGSATSEPCWLSLARIGVI